MGPFEVPKINFFLCSCLLYKLIIQGKIKEVSLKILIVSGFFPPYAPVSGSRVNKLAKYLVEQRHELKVLSPIREDQGTSLSPEISMDKVIFTEFKDINAFPSKVKKWLKNLFGKSEKRRLIIKRL